MTPRLLLLAVGLCLLAAVPLLSFQALVPSAPVFVASGPGSEILQVDTAAGTATTLFTATGGFDPGDLVLGGDGAFYVCDRSGSEIFRLVGGSLEVLYDRASAVSPADPEQPRGCLLRGGDLYFLSRRGRGASSETGVWVLRDVVGATGPAAPPQLILPLDSLGVGGEGMAVGPAGHLYFTFGNRVFRSAADLSGFQLFASLSGEGAGLAVAADGELLVALPFAGYVERFDTAGNRCAAGMAATFASGDRPGSVSLDASDNLWVTTARQSNGRQGKVWFVPRSALPACADLAGPLAATLVAGDLSGATGGTVGPTQSEPVTLSLTSDGDKSDTANLCTSLFNLQAADVDPTCLVDVSCRLLPQAEFEARTDLLFPDTTCADFPNAGGHCVEVRVSNQRLLSGATQECVRQVTGNWQFFALTPFSSPGLLFSPGALGNDPSANHFEENILTEFDPLPDPTDPLDPRMTGSKDSWGSGVVAVDNAPNRDPLAAAFASPASLQCSAPGSTVVTLDGSGSSDPDEGILDAGGVPIDGVASFDWSGPGGFSASTAVTTVTRSQLQVGDNTFTLTVADARGGSDSTDVVVEVVDGGPPSVAGATATPATLWPPNHEMVPIQVNVDGVLDDCGPGLTCAIAGVRSTDPQQNTGTGDKAPDWTFPATPVSVVNGSAQLGLELRAERSEGQVPGSVDDTRVYTITVVCTDTAGNTTSREVAVTVTSDQGGNVD